MRYRYFAFLLILLLKASASFAFELQDPQANNRRMKIELEAVPIPRQQGFEEYVQELAAAAQRDAKDANSKGDEELAKNKPPKQLNPMVLFRW